VSELLGVVGYSGQLRIKVDKLEADWILTVYVNQRLLVQLDLFTSRGQIPAVAQASKEVVEAALIAVTRFRRETAGVAAATLEETLKQLKSADARVIDALAKLHGSKLTIRQDGVELELSLQSDSKRAVSTQTETLPGVILAAGPANLFLLPFNRRSPKHLCLHPVHIKIPMGLRTKFDSRQVLKDFVENRARVQLSVQRELVVRKRQNFTYLLADWPPG
jgi:hypothetical protein